MAFESKDVEMINKAVEIKKFLYMRYICYRIILKHESSQRLQQIVSVPENPGEIHVIEFSKALDRSHYIKIVLSPRDKFPYRELLTNNYIKRMYNTQTKKAGSNYFFGESYTMVIKSLPPPFRENCFNFSRIGFDNEVDCLQDCVKKRTMYEMDGKIPYTIAIREELNERVISDIDLVNTEKDNHFMKIQKECSQTICKRKSCTHSQVMTVIFEKSGTVFRWKHVIPGQPSFEIISYPELPPIEFIIYLLSIISTWTGLSIISLNPMDLTTMAMVKISNLKQRMMGKVGQNDTTRFPPKMDVNSRLDRLESCILSRKISGSKVVWKLAKKTRDPFSMFKTM